jgi:hypothetical protein
VDATLPSTEQRYNSNSIPRSSRNCQFSCSSYPNDWSALFATALTRGSQSRTLTPLTGRRSGRSSPPHQPTERLEALIRQRSDLLAILLTGSRYLYGSAPFRSAPCNPDALGSSQPTQNALLPSYRTCISAYTIFSMATSSPVARVYGTV